MYERIYTIPLNEVFDECAEKKELGCPLCRLFRTTEENEIKTVLGAAMMEPETRIKTNKEGFCKKHFSQMFACENKLSLALILESHLAELGAPLEKDKGLSAMVHGGAGKNSVKLLYENEKSCYICGKTADIFEKFLLNTVYLWESEKDFREKFKNQPYFCLPHYKQLLEIGQQELNKKLYADFYSDISSLVLGYFAELRSDVTQFTKKFDYRHADEPWGNSKDAVERAIKFLTGDI